MLIAYDVALDLIRALRPVVVQLRKHSRDAADQVERAASSIVLNLAEGDRRRGRDPGRFFDMAHGSAGEIRGALDLADAWGWQVDSAQARALLDASSACCGASPVELDPRMHRVPGRRRRRDHRGNPSPDEGDADPAFASDSTVTRDDDSWSACMSARR
jgi:four helix bundle protein